MCEPDTLALMSDTTITETVNTPVIRLDLLAREVRSARNGLYNAIETRKVHPTYGVHKRDILDRYAELEALLFAYGVMADGEASAMRVTQARDVAEAHFGFDLIELRNTSKDA